MLRIPRRSRSWILLFALWLMLEPLFLPILQAGDSPLPTTPPVTQIKDNQEMAALDKAAKPDEVLEALLATQGILSSDMTNNKITGAAATKAYSDFLMMTTSAYDLMGAGESETFSLMGCMKAVNSLGGFGDVKGQADVIAQIKNRELLPDTGMGELITQAFGRCSKFMFTFIKTTKKGMKAGWKKNCLTSMANGINRMQRCGKYLRGIGDFLDNMTPPDRWAKTKNLYKFVRTGKNSAGHAGELNKAKAAGQVVGIALSVLTVVIETHALVTDEDRKSGIEGGSYTYKNVKSWANLTVALVALVGLFLFPLGTIASVAAIVVLIASYIGDKMGEFNAKWKQAYKRSWDFLEREDKEFKYFAEVCMKNPQLADKKLPKSRRCASWIKADLDYATWKRGVTDKKKLERIDEIYTACKKQGVLSTYYNRLSYSLPAMDLFTLQELWNKKASYMAHVPSEAEIKAENEKGFFTKAMETINPFNLFKAPVMYVKKWADTRSYEKSKNVNILPVYYNPDFILFKKYQYFLAERKDRRGGLYDLAGLRVQQAPFNYIWLVGVDSAQWNQEMILKAFEGDVFMCGTKEMSYLYKQMEEAIASLEKGADDQKTAKITARELCEQTENRLTALKNLLETYNQEKSENWEITKTWPIDDGKYTKIWLPLHKNFGWGDSNFDQSDNPPESKKKPAMNAKTIINRFRADIEQHLNYMPVSLNAEAANMIKLDLIIKSIFNRYALMKKLGDERQEAMQSFDKDFVVGTGVHKYLAENTFLGVEGKTFMDWLSDIKPAKEEMQKYTNLYLQKVEEYGKIAKDMENQKTGMWFWSKELPNPDKMIEQINKQLEEAKEVVQEYNEVKDEVNLTMKITDDAYFPKHKLPFGKEERNKPLDTEIDMEQISKDLEGDEVDLGALGIPE